ncbi:MAG: arsinothricin resistance N-acetyltransferase ArsN1 family B [Bacteroidota bacterium]
MIRPVLPADAPAIVAIYNYYISHSTITFEEVEIEADEMERRIRDVSTKYPWFVFEEAGHIQGYAYATAWKSRSAYDRSVECTVYLDPNAKGKGIGSRLYERLIAELKERKFHALIGGVALPNEASIRLHEKFGFEKVAQFREVGFKFGKWIDVGYWELLFKSDGAM